MAPPKKPAALRTGRPATGAYVRVPIKAPLAYLAVIEGEAARLQMGRGEFLNMLIQRRAGTLDIKRGEGAPVYRTREKDLAENGVYVWYANPETRKRIDSMRLRMGGMGLREFFVVVLNEWLDTPHGLELDDKGSRPKR